jgi:hypothetical protein
VFENERSQTNSDRQPEISDRTLNLINESATPDLVRRKDGQLCFIQALLEVQACFIQVLLEGRNFEVSCDRSADGAGSRRNHDKIPFDFECRN